MTHSNSSNYRKPKFWLTHLSLKIISAIAHLSSKNRIKLGKTLGWLLANIGIRRKRIASINLQKCFPELSNKQRSELLKNNMQATGRGLVEIASCWFTNLSDQKTNSNLIGKAHLDAALAKGNGVILLSFHLTSLEIGGCILGHHYDFLAMYKPNKDPLFNQAMCRGRLNHLDGLLQRNDLRGTVRALKNNKIIWYAPDQNYGGKSNVFVPFFDIPTATITSTSKLCKMTGAEVVPFTQRRLPASDSYELQLYPALENFPSGDDAKDATQINLFLENYLKKHPEDYMWLHQRFRARPAGEKSFY